MGKEILTVTKLEKFFGDHPVIKDLSFTLSEGERLALFAPSGAGKTTLIKILASLEQLDAGVFLLGSQNYSVIFQEARLFPYLTVEENIFLPLMVQKKPKTSAIAVRYRSWLEVCGLSGEIHAYPYQLSGGMKQKVSLIRGLLSQPEFIFMDEPFQSIDIQSKKEIVEFIKRDLPHSSMLFTSHIPEEISLIADRILMFRDNFLTNPVSLVPRDFDHSNALFVRQSVSPEERGENQSINNPGQIR